MNAFCQWGIHSDKYGYKNLSGRGIAMRIKWFLALAASCMSVSSVFSFENAVPVDAKCANCPKATGSCWSKLKSWMTHHETPQGLNHGGPRFQGERQVPLYLYFYNSCAEKCNVSGSNANANWSPTGWRNFTSTGHRMFDTPTQFGVGSGQ